MMLLLLLVVLAGAREYNWTQPSNGRNQSGLDLDFGRNHSEFTFSCESLKRLTVGPQNVTFDGPAHIDTFELDDDARVFIQNKSSFGKLHVSKHAHIKFHDCDVSVNETTHINGTVEFGGRVRLTDTKMVFGPDATFVNTGILELFNSSIHISSDLHVTNQTSILGGTVIVNGTLQTSGTVNITSSIEASSVSLAPSSVLYVTDVTTQGTIQALENATLVVASSVAMNSSVILPTRRLLSTLGAAGTCLFSPQTLFQGSGVLDCNVVFEGSVSPGLLEATSVTFFPQSVLAMSTNDLILSQTFLRLDGTIQVEAVEPGNFTIIMGTVLSGRFSSVTLTEGSLTYGTDSVSVLVETVSEPSSRDKQVGLIVGFTLGGTIALIVVAVFSRRPKERGVVIVTQKDIEHGYINPLRSN